MERGGDVMREGTWLLLIAAAVPTLSELGMIVLIFLVGLGSIYYLRKKRIA
jgi:hypothetical protein